MYMIYHIYENHEDFEICYNVETTNSKIRVGEIHNLFKILYNGHPMRFKEPFLKDVVEFGNRIDFESSWSSNMKTILHKCNVTTISRIEKTIRVVRKLWNDETLDNIIATVYDKPISEFRTGSSNSAYFTVKDIEKHNTQYSLNMDNYDINYYNNLYKNIIQRNPTNVELFDLSQSNSEHSRHWFFNGKLYADGVVIKETLFKMVKSTLNDNNSIIAFSDNASAIRGHNIRYFSPDFESNVYSIKDQTNHITFTAETHNFPTGVAPFPGAATGIGGRIRDNQSIGRGGLLIAGTAGYSVGNLYINDSVEHWETIKPYSRNITVSPRKILIEASNGASDYGNKIGEPIICGFTRSFGMEMPDRSYVEWIKPIMFTGGIGQMNENHKYKLMPKRNMSVVRLGGPAYRIGVGGGAASSRIQDKTNEKQDLTAVQRGDPEMENKLNRVVRTCIEMGKLNPIESIHDQGAGGLGNVVKEIIAPAGGKINIRDVTQGGSNMSVLDIWTSEFQESDTCLVKKENLCILDNICKRENLPIDMIGDITGDGYIKVYDENTNGFPVNLDLKYILSDIPQKEYNLKKGTIIKKDLRYEMKDTYDILKKVFRLVSVGSKQFLTNKVDRSVTGLIVQQQCIGKNHLPISDYALVAQSHFSSVGAVTAIGEQPIKGLLSNKANANLSIAEMLTNIMWVKIPDISNIKCSGNWMWPLKYKNEDYNLYETCLHMCETLKKIGVSIDGGKDSLSMSTKLGDDHVRSPGTIVISGYADCPNIEDRVTADFKRGGNNILFIDLGHYKNRVGGTAYAQVHNQLGDTPPDIDDPKELVKLFNAMQTCVTNKWITAGHDKSDGGLITTLLEMCFASDIGCEIDISFINKPDINRFLFNEESGVVIEVPDETLSDVERLLFGLDYHNLGKTTNDNKCTIRYYLESIFDNIKINEFVINHNVKDLLKLWQESSFKLERYQCREDCVDAEIAYSMSINHPRFTCNGFSFNEIKDERKFTVGIIRDEGSNGDREMASAFYYSGFNVKDINTADIIQNNNILEQLNGLAFVGGFSYSDVIAAGKGWYNVLHNNNSVSESIKNFMNRKDTFSLGICNGCQLMSKFAMFDGVDIEENNSGRFESRFSTVRISDSQSSIMLKDMDGMELGIWVAHKEGKFTSVADCDIALEYIDSDGNPTDTYPMNPNGSIKATAGVCSKDGRHLIMMPHPERCFLSWQVPYVPERYKERFYPWMKMFRNAYDWLDNM